jgi:pyrimidine 5'-nucleotidase
MTFKSIFFDLDATLYPADNGLWTEIGNRIEVFMSSFLGLSPEEIQNLKQIYYENYGTTLSGLQRHHNVDPQEYLAFVHDIPLRKYLQPDHSLRKIIQSLNQEKWIFTNSDHAHAQRVINELNLDNCFNGIIGLEALSYYCKPNREAFERALSLAGETHPNEIVYLDDSYQNLKAANYLGFFTILVGTDSPQPVVDLSILRPHDLPNALPELWNS